MYNKGPKRYTDKMLRIVSNAFLKLCIFLLMILTLSSLTYLWSLHVDFVDKQKESPFDHWKTTLLNPLFQLRCPVSQGTSNCSSPKIFMISARPEHQRRSSWESWKNHGVNMIDTKRISDLITDNSICKKQTWSNRLFSIYQKVFRDVLKKYTEDKDFIFVEDDVVLVDLREIMAEICMAQKLEFGFYSFYKPQSQKSCLYHHGTLCFYISRSYLEHLAKYVDQRDFCRLPIDIYIASSGPWYSTTKIIVKHNATHRFNN